MSNLSARLLVAAVAIPVIVLLAWLGGYFWLFFVGAVLVAAMHEFSDFARTKGAAPQTALMTAAGLALLLAFMHERLGADIAALSGGTLPYPLQWQAVLWIVLLFVIVAPLIELFRNRGSALMNTAMSFLGFFYIGLCLATVVGIREIFSVAEFPVGRVFGTAVLNAAQAAQLSAWGGATIIALLATIWICDTAAYVGGRTMGKHKLFERVSPKKTWEGAVWGFLGAIGAMAGAKYLALEYLPLHHALVIGAFVGSLGQIGDLVESLFKRDAGVKDSSALLPGHGGVFDRFDSLIFVSPVVFLYLDFIVFA